MSEEVFKKYRNRQEELNEQVYIDDDFLVIHVAYRYEIQLSRCNTPEKILVWAYHLTEKSWINANLIGKFIELAAEKIGWNPGLPV